MLCFRLLGTKKEAPEGTSRVRQHTASISLSSATLSLLLYHTKSKNPDTYSIGASQAMPVSTTFLPPQYRSGRGGIPLIEATAHILYHMFENSNRVTLTYQILPLLLHHKAKKFGVASVDATPINIIVFFHYYYITSRNPFDRYLTLKCHTLPLLPALLLLAPLSPAHAFSAPLSATGRGGVYSRPSNSPPMSTVSSASITV